MKIYIFVLTGVLFGIRLHLSPPQMTPPRRPKAETPGKGAAVMLKHKTEDTMRELTSHKVNPANDVLLVEALDGPGPGGASHDYSITTPPLHGITYRIKFQNGPIAEAGVNGLTHEALLAILIDRMEGFQSGPFANDYNAAALDHLRSAAGALHDRTRERMSRGVEGTLNA